MSSVLFVLATIFMAAPAVYVVRIERHLLAYRGEVFGRFVRATDTLRLAVAVVFVYFMIAVLVMTITGTLATMVEQPTTTIGIFGWAHLVMANVIFAMHWWTSVQIVRIVDGGPVPVVTSS